MPTFREPIASTHSRVAFGRDEVRLQRRGSGCVRRGGAIEQREAGGSAGGAAGLPGDTCELAAAPILTPTTLTGQTLAGYADDYRWTGTGCVPSTLSGPDRAYALRIPAGRRLRAVATPTGSWDPALQLVDTCTASTAQTCVASANRFGPISEQLDFVNTSSVDRNVFLVVDTTSATPGAFSLAIDYLVVPPGDVCGVAAPVIVDSTSSAGVFSLSTTVGPSMPPVGDLCSNTAAPITTSTSLLAQSLTGYANHFSRLNQGTTCSFDDGPDRVAAVTIPSGFRMRAIVTAPFFYAVNVVDGPAANCSTSPVVCLSRQQNGGTVTLLQENTGLVPRTVFVIFDRGSRSPHHQRRHAVEPEPHVRGQ